jgi:hypothetical protein
MPPTSRSTSEAFMLGDGQAIPCASDTVAHQELARRFSSKILTTWVGASPGPLVGLWGGGPGVRWCTANWVMWNGCSQWVADIRRSRWRIYASVRRVVAGLARVWLEKIDSAPSKCVGWREWRGGGRWEVKKILEATIGGLYWKRGV